jgi:hypothetical protein
VPAEQLQQANSLLGLPQGLVLIAAAEAAFGFTMPVGWLVMGPLSSIGFTPTLAAAAGFGSIPCVLVALVPRVRRVRRTPAGEILNDA